MGESRKISLKELSKHTEEADCWLAINGKVYDVTPFKDHPGGKDILVENSGKDATKEFDDIEHTATAKNLLTKYFIGEYVPVVDEKVDAKAIEASRSPWLMAIPILVIVLSIIYARLL